MNKLALVFPGQGSQYSGMSKSLCDRYAVARHTFEEASDVLGFDLRKLCTEGTLEELTRTENTQPALLTAGVATYWAYREEGGLEPHFAAGHSLGEITALTCAGAVPFADAVSIVRARGEYMAEAGDRAPSTMSAVRNVNVELVEEVCAQVTREGNGLVVLSNYNAQNQTVIAGNIAAVQRAGELLTEHGADVVALTVSGAFHTPLMQKAADRFQETIGSIAFEAPQWPVLSNVTARPYESADDIANLLVTQLTSPVRWQQSMDYLAAQGVTLAIELGPKAVLRNLIRKSIAGAEAYSFDREEDRPALKRALVLLPNVITKCLAVAVSTKNRNWDEVAYRKGVVESYRHIDQLASDLEQSGKQPTPEQMREALILLKRVFETKQTPLEEQTGRFREILDVTGTQQLFPEYLEEALQGVLER